MAYVCMSVCMLEEICMMGVISNLPGTGGTEIREEKNHKGEYIER